jgi:hypothetical protein
LPVKSGDRQSAPAASTRQHPSASVSIFACRPAASRQIC